jgi:hypothetical protein
MSLDNPNGIESSVSKNTKQRRIFLKRATAGAVIASIPGRSAWAGMAGSIVASGNASDFQQGKCTKLRGSRYFENDTNARLSFSTEFGSFTFDRYGNKNEFKSTFYHIYTAVSDMNENRHILSKKDKNKLKDIYGIGKINLWLFVFYFNAKYSNLDTNIEYNPASQHGGLSEFAHYLYKQAEDDPKVVARLLRSTYHKYKHGYAC